MNPPGRAATRWLAPAGIRVRGIADRCARPFTIIAVAGAAGLLATACASAPASANRGGSSSPSAPASTSSAPASPAPTASGGATQAAGGGLTPCTVITEIEASVALGQLAKPPIAASGTVEGGSACVFYGPQVPAGTNPNMPVADSVRVILVMGPKAKQAFDSYRSQVRATAVRDLGYPAFYDEYGTLSVLKGDAYLRISVSLANNLPVEKLLAFDALRRV